MRSPCSTTACGGVHKATPPTTTAATKTTANRQAASADLRIGLVGPLTVDVAGAATEHGTLAHLADAPLVVVSARAASLPAVAAAARSHPASHFAVVGESTKADRAPNLVGLVLGDVQAATLGGLVAGYAAADAGGTAPRVAWVGPEERPLATAFARGVHRALPAAVVLDEWSQSIPARCKEAALTAIGRGATVVMAHGGLCARAAIAGAHQQNVPGLQLGDFQFPGVAANLVARDAAAGVFHGGEDIVFGQSSGAVGIGVLDPRISVATTVLARTAAQDLASGRRTGGIGSCRR